MDEVIAPGPGRVSPTVRRQRLAKVLAGLRTHDGRTAADIAREVGVAKTTITRLETPKNLQHPKRDLIERVLNAYGVDEATRAKVRQLVEESRWWDWWHPYKAHLPASYATYLGLEAETAMQRLYHPGFIPGPLETAEYGAALLAQLLPALPDDQVAAFAAERHARHLEMLTGPDPVTLQVVLGEAALRQIIGGRELMAAQLTHLHQMMELSNVTVAVVPFTAGAYDGAAPINILSFPEPTDPEMAFLPNQLGGQWANTASEVDTLVTVFERLQLACLDRDATLQRIADAADQFRAGRSTAGS